MATQYTISLWLYLAKKDSVSSSLRFKWNTIECYLYLLPVKSINKLIWNRNYTKFRNEPSLMIDNKIQSKIMHFGSDEVNWMRNEAQLTAAQWLQANLFGALTGCWVLINQCCHHSHLTNYRSTKCLFVAEKNHFVVNLWNLNFEESVLT